MNNTSTCHRNLINKFVAPTALHKAEVCLGHRILYINDLEDMLENPQPFEGTDGIWAQAYPSSYFVKFGLPV